MSYNESCQCQSCLNQRHQNMVDQIGYGQRVIGVSWATNRHIEPVKSLEQRKVEALESIAKLAERIANKLYERD